VLVVLMQRRSDTPERVNASPQLAQLLPLRANSGHQQKRWATPLQRLSQIA
jgi:hypothetical protein